MDAVAPNPEDSEPVRMTGTERTVWASAIAVAVTSGGYVALMATRLRSQPVAEIAWAGPMLWAMGLALAGSVLLSIGFAIAGAAGRRGADRAAACDEVATDVRDREIGRFGGRAAMWVLSAGAGGALVLAMLDAGPFWIGNLIFLFGTAGALVEAGTKIRLYRRGF